MWSLPGLFLYLHFEYVQEKDSVHYPENRMTSDFTVSKYWFGHPETCLFIVYKAVWIGSAYSKKSLITIHKTALRMRATHSAVCQDLDPQSNAIQCLKLDPKASFLHTHSPGSRAHYGITMLESLLFFTLLKTLLMDGSVWISCHRYDRSINFSWCIGSFTPKYMYF